MQGNIIKGALFFWQGVRLIFSPSLRHYIIVPVIVNIFLWLGTFIALAWYLYHHFGHYLENYPHWVILIVSWLFWLFYGITAFLLGTLFFTLLTNIIASPFYGLLAEKVEKIYLTQNLIQKRLESGRQSFSVMESEGGWFSLLKSLPRTLGREGLKILYFIPWFIFCGIFVIFPPLWTFLPFVWGLVLAWILSIQYVDYIADNQGVSLKNMLATLKQEPLTALGFGGVASLAMAIPGANLFVPPAAVAGGCLLWISIQHQNSPKNGLNSNI